MSVTLLAALAACSGTVSGLLPLLQIARMVRARSADGVSLGFLAGGVANGTAWGAYGIALHNPTVIFSNSLWVLTGSVMLAVAAGYRRRERAACCRRLGRRRYLTSESILNIGRYMLMMISPTIAPTPIIITGSMMLVRAETDASTSSS
jgi:hypothetical protein